MFVFFSLSFLLSIVSSFDITSIKLNEISYNKLASLEKSSIVSLSHILSTIGIIKISLIPNLNSAQNDALSSLSNCLITNKNDENMIFETVMNDGTKRLTIGAKSLHGETGQMSHECGKSSKTLRSIVDMVSRQLFVALDFSSSLTSPSIDSDINDKNSNVNNLSYLMKPYVSFAELFDKGEHLEHLHSFYNAKKSIKSDLSSPEHSTDIINTKNMDKKKKSNFNENINKQAALEMHTDAGLLIAMTSGYYTSESHTTSNNSKKLETQRGLFITLPSGQIVHVDEKDISSNDIIIMIGQGGADWLSPRLGAHFRAVPHSLVIDLGDDETATRNWYGKMFFPPNDAELYDPHTFTQNKKSITFQQYRNQQFAPLQSASRSVNKNFNSIVVHSDTDSTSNIYLPAACGPIMNENNLLKSIFYLEYEQNDRVLVPESCTVSTTHDPGVMCWMRCMSTSGISCPTNTKPTCIDITTGEEADGHKHCPSGTSNCKLECADNNGHVWFSNTPIATPTQNPTTVTDDGAATKHHDHTSSNEKTSSKSQFCIGSGTSMSMSGFISSATEAGLDSECFVYLFPTWILDDSTKFAFACLGTIVLGIIIHSLSKLKLVVNTVHNIHIKTKFWLHICIYFLQIVLSYIVMLVAMTYSVELFFMVCVGLTIGYGIFHPQNQYFSISQNTETNLYDRHRHDNGNEKSVLHTKYESTAYSHLGLKDSIDSSSSVHIEPCCQGLDYEANESNSLKSSHDSDTGQSFNSSNNDMNKTLLSSANHGSNNNDSSNMKRRTLN